jgi:hypothetical protein
VLSTFVVGLFLALWVVRRRSLLGAMGWHAGWNWLLAVGFDLPLSGLDANLKSLLVGLKATGPDWLSGGSQGPEGSLLSIAVFALATAWLAWRRPPPTGCAAVNAA